MIVQAFDSTLKRRPSHFVLLLIVVWYIGSGFLISLNAFRKLSTGVAYRPDALLSILSMLTGLVALLAFLKAWHRPIVLFFGLLISQAAVSAIVQVVAGEGLRIPSIILGTLLGFGSVLYVIIERNTPPVKGGIGP